MSTDERLRKAAASGVRWTSLATAVNAALGFALTAVLAHLSSASDFGVGNLGKFRTSPVTRTEIRTLQVL